MDQLQGFPEPPQAARRHNHAERAFWPALPLGRPARPTPRATLTNSGFRDRLAFDGDSTAIPIRRQVSDWRLDLADDPGCEQAALQLLVGDFLRRQVALAGVLGGLLLCLPVPLQGLGDQLILSQITPGLYWSCTYLFKCSDRRIVISLSILGLD